MFNARRLLIHCSDKTYRKLIKTVARIRKVPNSCQRRLGLQAVVGQLLCELSREPLLLRWLIRR